MSCASAGTERLCNIDRNGSGLKKVRIYFRALLPGCGERMVIIKNDDNGNSDDDS